MSQSLCTQTGLAQGSVSGLLLFQLFTFSLNYDLTHLFEDDTILSEICELSPNIQKYKTCKLP